LEGEATLPNFPSFVVEKSKAGSLNSLRKFSSKEPEINAAACTFQGSKHQVAKSKNPPSQIQHMTIICKNPNAN
jgi:hypothetical protein